MKQPSYEVYLNRKTGEFVVSRQFEDEHGLHCDTGPYIRFNVDQMKKEGLRFADEHFIAFETRKSDEPSEFETMSLEEQNRFHKAHKNVWVYRSKFDEVVFWPSRPAKRGQRVVAIGLDPEEAIHLEWPTTPDKFFDSLMAAFENAH